MSFIDTITAEWDPYKGMFVRSVSHWVNNRHRFCRYVPDLTLTRGTIYESFSSVEQEQRYEEDNF